MNLVPLGGCPQVSVYFDSWNDWLYVEWEGELTLPVVQRACVELGRCVLTRPYARVLNNNVNMSGVGLEVGAWLALHFMPHLPLAGVKYMAWVCSPTLAGLTLVQTILRWLPHLEATTFTDVEAAVSWLQQRRRAPGPEPAHAPAIQAQLAAILADLERTATGGGHAAPPTAWWRRQRA